MHTYIYVYNWEHHPPQTIYISTRGKELVFSYGLTVESKADGASRGGSLLAEMSWIYRNKTENERQENILV